MINEYRDLMASILGLLGSLLLCYKLFAANVYLLGKVFVLRQA